MQIEIWSQLQHRQHIWNVDATGSIIEDVKNKKKPYLYSIVCHDEQNKCIIPIAEFVTTSHNHISVTSYFYLVKKYFEKYSKAKSNFIFAPVMVTDFSWTLISSIIEAFNSMTVIEYLNISFEILVLKKDFLIFKTILYLCAAHFIKLIVKKVKDAEPSLNQEVKKCFVFCFTLLQNSTNLIEFECYFINILRMFNSPTINATSASAINYLRSQISNRDPSDLAYANFEGLGSKEDSEREKNFELLSMLDDIQLQTIKTLKKASKFQSYFENILNANMKIISNYDITKHLNPYYSPKLFLIIMNYIYIIPFWTGIMLNLKTGHLIQYQSKKRTTNNPVENHFEFDKNKLLNGKLRVKPSEFIAPKFRFILSKFITFYLNDLVKQRNFKKQIVDEIEKWKISKDYNRVKSFYYQNIANFDSSIDYGSANLYIASPEEENHLETNVSHQEEDESSDQTILLSKFKMFTFNSSFIVFSHVSLRWKRVI